MRALRRHDGLYRERYKFTGKERDGETGYDYFGARYFWSAFGHWLSVDPLADKYPGISPYAYCAWNPIKYVDPDGREKHNKMDPYSPDINQRDLYCAAENFVEPSTSVDTHIFYFSHGSPDAMYPHKEGEMNAEGFVQYLEGNSKLWQETKDKSTLTIVLMSCETGQGENSIAQQVSKLLPEATILAPTEMLKAGSDGKVKQILGVAVEEAKTIKK
ncbi:MAG: RHS repeat-associated core domain-containing protein, partial [Paludibacteraceae bacterium]|nr:RHS repeat-associated core domain-containing protein [Paludibacteraceae bacterium]